MQIGLVFPQNEMRPDVGVVRAFSEGVEELGYTHVLAYGGIPVAASLVLWIFTALLVGEAAIIDKPAAETDGFVGFVLHAQLAAYLLLLFWSIVLQVMGFSEILGLATRKAFAVWVLGQLLGLLAVLFLTILMTLLFPGLLPPAPH